MTPGRFLLGSLEVIGAGALALLAHHVGAILLSFRRIARVRPAHNPNGNPLR